MDPFGPLQTTALEVAHACAPNYDPAAPNSTK